MHSLKEQRNVRCSRSKSLAMLRYQSALIHKNMNRLLRISLAELAPIETCPRYKLAAIITIILILDSK
jgi:hypothetical protein